MAKRMQSRTKSVEQQVRNDLELAAWNEWKVICSILKCSAEHAASLKNRMWISSREKLRWLLEASIPEWEDEYSEEGWRDEISSRFDEYIREGVDNTTGKRLNYKDAIWNAIEENKRQGYEDPPLKVIRGKLTAPRRVLDGVLEKLVTEKGWTPKVIAHKSIGVSSLNVNARCDGEEEGGEQIDQIWINETGFVGSSADADKAVDVDEDNGGFDYAAERMRNDFSFKECVLLMAHFKRIPCDSPLLVAAIGVRKSQVSKLLNGSERKSGKKVPGVLEKLRTVLGAVRDIAMDDKYLHELTKVVLGELETKIKTEKCGRVFLSEIEKI